MLGTTVPATWCHVPGDLNPHLLTYLLHGAESFLRS